MSDDRMAYRAFSVIRQEGKEDFWLPIGAAFPHKDGKGLNITLQALPIDGKIVLRVPKDESDPPPKDRNGDRERRGSSERSSNDRRDRRER